MEKKRYIIELGHPKHYHMFKGFIRHYREQGREVTVLARNKDVLLKLLEADDCRYTKFGPYKDGLLNKLLITPLLLVNYLFILLKTRPHVVFSKASPYASFFSKLFRFNHVIFPDSDGFKSNDILMKYARVIVTPSNYNNDYGEKHKKVDGFFENLYLHPNRFSPDPDVPRRYQINPDERYTVIRFVGWGAHHDGSDSGFTHEEKLNLVKTLSSFGPVYITSEKPLHADLEPYRLKINPEDIHHVLYHASLYIGDSQTMATEASLLGVPSIRTNSFVGDQDMSNFKLLEHEYGLLFNFSDTKKAIAKAEELISSDHYKIDWQEKRQNYYNKDREFFQQVLDIVEET